MGTKLLRELIVVGVSCSDWGDIWAADDEGEQGDVCVEGETGEGS